MFLGDFFKQLFTSRISGAQMSAQGKAWSAQSRAKSAVAARFNKVVDKGVAKVANPVKGAVKGARGGKEAKGGGAPAKKADEGGGRKMGFFSFGKKGQKAGAAPAPTGEEADAKTQAINIAQFEDTQFKPCVGWVVVMDGPQTGRDYRLVAGRNRIGTDADMEVVLTDPYVSSHHATIVYNDEGIYQISDAGSTNGTKVNGKRAMQAQIVDNDTLVVGHTTLRFKALD
jgi:hypothetical protein